MWSLWRASLTYHMFSKFNHRVESINTSFLYCQIIFYCINIPYFIYPCISWWIISFFEHSGYYEKSCYEHSCTSLHVVRHDPVYPGYITTSGIPELYRKSMFNNLRKSQTIFKNCCTSSYSLHQHMMVPIFLYPHQHIGEGNGNPLQYSCLANPMDRGAW